jgi:hypothetical protein
MGMLWYEGRILLGLDMMSKERWIGNGHANKVVQGKAVNSISLGIWLFQGPNDSTKGVGNILDFASLESLTLNSHDHKPLDSSNIALNQTSLLPPL